MYADPVGRIFGLLATSRSAGRNACSRPRPFTTSASARLSFVTKLGLTGTLCGSWPPSAIVCTATRSPPICRAMSATSGVEATTRSTAPPEPGESARNAAPSAAHANSAGREAMRVTPQEGGPLEGEPLVVVLAAQVELIDLEAQTLELGREPGREGRVRALQLGRAERILGVVEPGAERVAAAQEGLQVGVAAVAPEALVAQQRIPRARVDTDLDVLELFIVPVPLRADHEPLIEAARARPVGAPRNPPRGAPRPASFPTALWRPVVTRMKGSVGASHAISAPSAPDSP